MPVERPTQGALLVTGIVVSPPSRVLRAIIAAPGTKERSYRIGDSLPDGSTLTAIHADRVILRRDGSDRAVKLDSSDYDPAADPSARGSGPAPRPAALRAADNAMPRTAAAAIRANPVLLAQLLPLEAVLDRQRMVALRVGEPEDKSLVKELKLVPGDVITAINGVELNGPDPDAWMQSPTARVDALTLKVYREGRVEMLRY